MTGSRYMTLLTAFTSLGLSGLSIIAAPPERHAPTASVAPVGAQGQKLETTKPALDGYCPVSYQTEPTPVGGDPAIQVVYHNRVYYLANEEAKATFMANPERYAPRLNGMCATALGGPYGNRFEGDPTVYDVVNNFLYLFSSERAKRAYEIRKKAVISSAEMRYATPRLDGTCVVSYQTRQKHIIGEAAMAYPYGHWMYHFIDREERAAFAKDPEKYIPQYDTFCAEAMSRGLQYPGSPERFAVYNGKTYLFYDEKAQAQFQANPAAMIAKADAEWAKYLKRPKPGPGH